MWFQTQNRLGPYFNRALTTIGFLKPNFGSWKMANSLFGDYRKSRFRSANQVHWLPRLYNVFCVMTISEKGNEKVKKRHLTFRRCSHKYDAFFIRCNGIHEKKTHSNTIKINIIYSNTMLWTQFNLSTYTGDNFKHLNTNSNKVCVDQYFSKSIRWNFLHCLLRQLIFFATFVFFPVMNALCFFQFWLIYSRKYNEIKWDSRFFTNPLFWLCFHFSCNSVSHILHLEWDKLDWMFAKCICSKTINGNLNLFIESWQVTRSEM